MTVAWVLIIFFMTGSMGGVAVTQVPMETYFACADARDEVQAVTMPGKNRVRAVCISNRKD